MIDSKLRKLVPDCGECRQGFHCGRCLCCMPEEEVDAIVEEPKGPEAAAEMEALREEFRKARISDDGKMIGLMRCLGRDGLDGLPCGNTWIASLADGLAIPERCPKCGSLETEEIES